MGPIEGQLTEKCGVVGVWGRSDDAARMVYYGLWALQHRGQESSGIASTDGQQLYRHAGAGLVAHVYLEADLDELTGYGAIGHNRYSTSGGSRNDHTQPILDPSERFTLAHNGNLPSVAALEEFLKSKHIATQGMNDTGMMSAAIGYYLGSGFSLEDAITEAWPLFTGAFSCVAMDKTKLVAFRDECGIRPLSLGKLHGGLVVASETCAFDVIGAAYLRDIAPGEMVVIDRSGIKSRQVRPARQRLDLFEYIYFARPDSYMMGRKINEVRRRLGQNLAEEHPIKADVVIPVPDSAIPAALGYAQRSGIRFEHGLIKNRYIHRTFIRPSQRMRERDLAMKLNPLPEVLMGKRVIIVDDSIVRGSTTRKLVKMVMGAGAKSIHILASSPPVKYPDFYGIDTPRQTDLIAATKSPAEIGDEIGADSVGFLSIEGTVSATGHPARRLSLSCFNGEYPIDIRERAGEVLQLTI